MKIPAFQVITSLEELIATVGDPPRLAAFLKQQQDFARAINEQIIVFNQFADLETQRSEATAMMAEATQRRAMIDDALRDVAAARRIVDDYSKKVDVGLAVRERACEEAEGAVRQRETVTATALAEAQAMKRLADEAKTSFDEATARAGEAETQYRAKLAEVRAAVARLGG